MSKPQEQWKPVVGYEGAYEVSDQGRVRSLDRVVYAGGGRSRRHAGRLLSIYRGDGYAKVRLKISGEGRTRNVHALVAEAFLGPRPEGTEICHGRKGKGDNSVANLRYDTHSANQKDQALDGVHPYARRTHCLRGHQYTPENTLRRENGGRRCRACDKARGKRRWQDELTRRVA